MNEYRRSEILSGLFIVAALATLALFAFRVGKFDLLGLLKAPAVPLRAHFTDVKSLEAGAPVRVGGRRVGQVIGVRLVKVPLSADQIRLMVDLGARGADDELEPGMIRQLVEVDFEISDPGLRLNVEDAYVRLANDNLLTPVFLLLDPGSWDAGDEPRTVFDAGLESTTMISVRERAGFDELFSIARPMMRKAQSAAERVDRLLRSVEESGGIAKIAERADDVLTDLQQITKRLADDVVTEQNAADLRAMMADARLVAKNAAAFTDAAGELLDRDADPRLHRMIDDLAAVSASLNQRLTEIDASLRGVLAAAQGMLVENRAELAEAVRRLRRAMWEGEMALRKIRVNPAALLFGAEGADYQAGDVDDAPARLGGRAAPFGQRDESTGARD